ELVFHLPRDRRPVEVAHRRGIGQEDAVELGHLRQPRAVDEMTEIHVAVGRHVRMAPGGIVVAEIGDREPEAHAALAAVHSAASATAPAYWLGGRLRPRFSRSVRPSYSVRNRPRRCNSGMTRSTKSSPPPGR